MTLGSFLSFFIPLVVTLGGFAWWLRGRLDDFRFRLGFVETRLSSLIGVLASNQVISRGGAELLMSISYDKIFRDLGAKGSSNPLTEEDRQKLLRYARKAQNKQVFTQQEARDSIP